MHKKAVCKHVSCVGVWTHYVHQCMVCVVLTDCAAFLQYQLYRALPILHPEVEHPGLTLYNVSGGGVDGAKS